MARPVRGSAVEPYFVETGSDASCAWRCTAKVVRPTGPFGHQQCEEKEVRRLRLRRLFNDWSTWFLLSRSVSPRSIHTISDCRAYPKRGHRSCGHHPKL